jgi:hypothetical protein
MSGFSLISTTRRIRSERKISLSVDLKASTNQWGRASINPTVSVKRAFLPPRSRARVMGTSVVKSISFASTLSFTIALKRVLFPALVYPAREINEKPFLCLKARRD